MLNDPLANALSKIMNYESVGKKVCLINPYSKMLKKIITILNENLYIGSFEEIEHVRGNSLKVNLIGSINRVSVIKPRFAVRLDDFEKFEKRYLPAHGVGFLLISTPKGIMTHREAKEKRLGGRLIAYCY